MIREARTTDLGSILELCWEMHSETEYSRFSLNKASAEKFVRYMLETSFVCVAENEDGVFGVMIGAVSPMWFSDETEAVDVLLYVAPSARGGFVGKRMVEMFKSWADGKGVSRTVVGISTGGDIDRKGRWVERIGFEPIGGIYARY
jgi:GNAT superfamily N-acetyltransferase